jgi:hypothetical protein
MSESTMTSAFTDNFPFDEAGGGLGAITEISDHTSDEDFMDEIAIETAETSTPAGPRNVEILQERQDAVPKRKKKEDNEVVETTAELQGGYYYYHLNLVASVIANLAVIIYAAVSNKNTEFVAVGTLAAMFVSILWRNEVWINCWYAMITAVPKRSSVAFRRVLARYVFSLGGYHSGFGIASLAWLAFLASKTVSVSLVLNIVVLILVVGVIWPAIIQRSRYHNLFEFTHRSLGWAALGVTWVFVINFGVEKGFDGGPVIALLVFIAATTLLVAHPWLRARYVPVKATRLSSHAIKLTFWFNDNSIAPGAFGRISHEALGEWHSFACISSDPETPTHSMVIASAGDWTKNLIENPPQAIWVRGIRTCGFMNTVNMFNSTVLVATGAGIAPVLPFLLQSDLFPQVKHVVWTTKQPRETFGDEITDAVLNFKGGLTVWDSSEQGRADVAKLVLEAARATNPEAIHIVSNKTLTIQVVRACRLEGFCCYGAIWDS